MNPHSNANIASIASQATHCETRQQSRVRSQSSSFRASFDRALESSDSSSGTTKEQRIENAIQAASARHNVPPALIRAVIQQESGFKPDATSHCGAMGLMQLMPGTAKDMGVQNAYNIEQNVDGGTKYLGLMLDRYDGDFELALAAYNAGPGNVDKHGGIPPFAETQNYVPSVMAHMSKMEDAGLPATLQTPAMSPAAIEPTVVAHSDPVLVNNNALIEQAFQSAAAIESARSEAVLAGVVNSQLNADILNALDRNDDQELELAAPPPHAIRV